jgi:hypothetical protein
MTRKTMTTRNRKHKAAKQVLTEAANAPHFFDSSDAERLIWMLERAFDIGREEGGLRHKAEAERDGPQIAKGRKSA